MTVHYSKVWGGVFLGLGILTTMLNLLARTLIPNGIVGLILILVGVLYLTRTYVEVSPTTLEVRAPIGRVAKRYTFSSLGALVIEDGKIFVTEGGQRTRVKLSRMLADKRDWQAFVRMIKQQQAASPVPTTITT